MNDVARAHVHVLEGFTTARLNPEVSIRPSEARNVYFRDLVDLSDTRLHMMGSLLSAIWRYPSIVSL